MNEFETANFCSSLQAIQYDRLRAEGYEYVDDKGDTIIVGLDHDVALSCEWLAHTVEINSNGDMIYHYH
jgi:GT2 family glycosyltransferase